MFQRYSSDVNVNTFRQVSKDFSRVTSLYRSRSPHMNLEDSNEASLNFQIYIVSCPGAIPKVSSRTMSDLPTQV